MPCPKCNKPESVCVCDKITAMTSRLRVIILQHPQEQDIVLGSAPLVALSLPQASIRVGLSWANAAAAIGSSVTPGRWIVAYPLSLPREVTEKDPAVLMNPQGGRVDVRKLDGVILLDGSWTQAKTLWWRNPWLLRLNRIVLNPQHPSIYGKLRKEPRKSMISTLEAAGQCLTALGEGSEIETQLNKVFRTMVQRARDEK